jgi:hypothetical protein
MLASVPTYAGDAFTSDLRWALLVLVCLAIVVGIYIIVMAQIDWRRKHPSRRSELLARGGTFTVDSRPRRGYSRRHP